MCSNHALFYLEGKIYEGCDPISIVSVDFLFWSATRLFLNPLGIWTGVLDSRKNLREQRNFNCVLTYPIKYFLKALCKNKGNFNPLSANVGYIRHDTVVTSDSCNSRHSERILTFSCKSLKFSTKWYTKLCILVDPFLRNSVTKYSIF